MKKRVDELEARDKKMSPGPGKELLLTAGVCGLGALLSVCTKSAANSDASASVAATPVNVGMMMLLCELIKLALSLFMLHRSESGLNVWANISYRSWATSISPSVAFTIQNNCTYIALRYIDPVSFNILMNMRLFVVALLQKLVLKRSLSTELWMILVCIVSGISGFIYNSQQASASQSVLGRASYFWGISITAVVLMASSLSTVVNELVYKVAPPGFSSLHLGNAMLYAGGVVVNGCIVAFQVFFQNGSLFGDMKFIHFAIILVQVAFGLTVALTIHTLGALYRSVIGALQVVVVSMMNGLMGIEVPWVNLIFTVGILIPAVLAYSLISVREKAQAAAAAAATASATDDVQNDSPGQELQQLLPADSK